MHLAASAIVCEESAQSAQSAQDEAKTTDQRTTQPGNGQVPWADFHEASQESAQETCPNGAERHADGQYGQIGQVIPA
jgi:hypothetical protein